MVCHINSGKITIKNVVKLARVDGSLTIWDEFPNLTIFGSVIMAALEILEGWILEGLILERLIRERLVREGLIPVSEMLAGLEILGGSI